MPTSLINAICKVRKCIQPLTAGPFTLVIGLEEQLPLPPSVQQDPATLVESASLGVKSLPDSLHRALNALDTDTALYNAVRAGLGDALMMAYLAVRQAEEKHGCNIADILFKY